MNPICDCCEKEITKKQFKLGIAIKEPCGCGCYDYFCNAK